MRFVEYIFQVVSLVLVASQIAIAPTGAQAATVLGYGIWKSAPADVSACGVGQPAEIGSILCADTNETTSENGLVQKVSTTSNRAKEKVTINFPSPRIKKVQADLYQLSVGASNQNAIVIVSSSTPSICTISSGNYLKNRTIGTCTLTAEILLSPFYEAEPVTQSFRVYGDIQNVQVNGPSVWSVPAGAFTVTTNNYSTGNAVTVESKTPSICTVSGSTVTPVSAGTCSLIGTSVGTDDRWETSTAKKDVAIYTTKQEQVFTGNVASSYSLNNPVYCRGNIGAECNSLELKKSRVSVSSNSGLSVTLSSLTRGICDINFDPDYGYILSSKLPGKCEIQAAAAGDGGYLAKTSTIQTTILINSLDTPYSESSLNLTPFGKTAEQGTVVDVNLELKIKLALSDSTIQKPEYKANGNYKLKLFSVSDRPARNVLLTLSGALTDGVASISLPTRTLAPGEYFTWVEISDPLITGTPYFFKYGFLTVTPETIKPQPAIVIPTTPTYSGGVLIVSKPISRQAPAVTIVPIVMTANIEDGSSAYPRSGVAEASTDVDIVERTFDMNKGKFIDKASDLNQTGKGNQFDPDSVVLSNDTMVTAWTSKTGSKLGLFGRISDLKGKPLGEEFRINDASTSKQSGLVELIATNGGFGAVWESTNGLVWRAFDLEGKPKADPLLLKIKGTDPVMAALPASSGSGELVLLGYRDTRTGRPMVRILNVTRTKVSAALTLSQQAMVDGTRISAVTLYKPGTATIKLSSSVAFGWTEKSTSSGQDVKLAVVKVAAGKMKLGKTIIANTTSKENQSDPGLAAFPKGGLVAVWTASATGGSDVDAAFFANDLDPYGTEFPIATSEKGTQSRPEVAVTSKTDLLIAWLSTLNGKTSFIVRPFDLNRTLPQ